jgi:hypothetical protein
MKILLAIIMIFVAVNAFSQEMAPKVGGHYENGFVCSFYSRIDGKELTFGLTEKQANQLSAWKTSMENPPVAVRQAIQSARKKLEELFPAKRVWTLEDVTLKPVVFTLDAKDGVELWQYHITFARHSDPPNPHSSDTDGKVTLIVLMDGTAISPSIKTK